MKIIIKHFNSILLMKITHFHEHPGHSQWTCPDMAAKAMGLQSWWLSESTILLLQLLVTGDPGDGPGKQDLEHAVNGTVAI